VPCKEKLEEDSEIRKQKGRRGMVTGRKTEVERSNGKIGAQPRTEG